jgi:hypothetical protein
VVLDWGDVDCYLTIVVVSMKHYIERASSTLASSRTRKKSLSFPMYAIILTIKDLRAVRRTNSRSHPHVVVDTQ